MAARTRSRGVRWGKGSRGTARSRVGVKRAGRGKAPVRGRSPRMAFRSKSPTAATRKRYGGGKGLKKGSFPVDSVAHAKSAIKLRGHGNKKAVLNKVARSRYAKNPTVKRMLANARKADRKGKK